jgi:hypothetical protein
MGHRPCRRSARFRRGTRIPLTSARDWMPSASSHFRQSLLGRSDRGSAVRRDTSGTVADDLLARLLPLATRADSATPGHLGRSQSASSCTHDGGQDRLPCPGSRWSPRPSAWRPPAPHRHPRADRRYPRQNHATIWPTAVTRDWSTSTKTVIALEDHQPPISTAPRFEQLAAEATVHGRGS